MLKALHFFALADITTAAALAERATGDGAEAATLLREPLVGHLPVLAVDGHAHAAGADEHASTAPQLHGAEVVGELSDQVACDDRTCESKDGSARVHHAGPLAEFCLRGGIRSEDVCDGGRRKAYDCTGEDTKNDDEAKGGLDGVSKSPEDEDEE